MKRRRVFTCEACEGFQAETVQGGRRLCHLCAHGERCQGEALADCTCPRDERYPAPALMRIDVAVAAGVVRARQEFEAWLMGQDFRAGA